MKKALFAVATFVATTAFAVATLWKNDKAHSQLAFTVTHLGVSDVSGTFNDFDVTIQSEKEDFSDAIFTLTARVNSIDTRIEARDKHLKSPDFFNAVQYETITFKSTGIEKQADKNFKLKGDLTMHGITKPVVMDLVYRGSVTNPMNKKETIGFQLTGSLKRSDFGIGANFPEAVVSDIVQIKADGEFTK